MRWTGWVGIAAGLLALAGCGYGYHMVAFQARYSTASRPHASYFCYDCHGYRYFDPYYDYCMSYGFRYRWSAHPRVVAIYRDRYVGIREGNPDYGRYRYREGYRATPRYRAPRDYEAWRGEGARGPAPEARPGRKEPAREPEGDDRGKKQKRKGERGKGPRDIESRSTLPGGAT